MSSAFSDTPMPVSTELLTKQCTDLINCGRFILGKGGSPRHLSVEAPIAPDAEFFPPGNFCLGAKAQQFTALGLAALQSFPFALGEP